MSPYTYILPLAVFVYFAVYCIIQYNSLVKHRREAHESWSRINEALRSRHRLVTELNGIILRETQDDSLTVNADKMTDGSPYSRLDANRDAQMKLLSVFESLKSDPQFAAKEGFFEAVMNIQIQLDESQTLIHRETERCNDAISKYNTIRGLFPGVIIAGLAKFDYEPPLPDGKEKEEE